MSERVILIREDSFKRAERLSASRTNVHLNGRSFNSISDALKVAKTGDTLYIKGNAEDALSSDLHYWLYGLKSMSQMLTTNNSLPHFYRHPNGSLVTTCDECRRAYKLRRQYQEVNRV